MCVIALLNETYVYISSAAKLYVGYMLYALGTEGSSKKISM